LPVAGQGSAAFGVLAALLAAVGLYGVMAYNMSRRTSEIGIRIALGARPDDIRRLALGESLRLTGAGVMVGIPGALAAGRLVRGLLYGIRATDPWVLGAAALVMITAALLAGWLPAARAARIDPNSALRQGCLRHLQREFISDSRPRGAALQLPCDAWVGSSPSVGVADSVFPHDHCNPERPVGIQGRWVRGAVCHQVRQGTRRRDDVGRGCSQLTRNHQRGDLR
jgi:FtsX-like permease family